MKNPNEVWPRVALLVLLGILLGGAACAPDVSGEVEVWTVGVVGESVGLVRTSVEVSSLQRLESDLLSVQIGGHVVYGDPSWTFEGGHAPWLGAREVDGAFLGSDLDALSLASYFAHAQAARRYFGELGLGEQVEDLPPMVVRAFATDRVGARIYPDMIDNAAFDPGVKGFTVARQVYLHPGVVLWSHPAVVVHEFGHAVTDHLLFGSRGELVDPDPVEDPSVATLWAVDEGLSDLHAALFMGRPYPFVGVAIGAIGGWRDLGTDARYTQAMQDAMESFPEDPTPENPWDEFDPYATGDVVASVLWDHLEALVANGMDPKLARLRVGRLAFETVRTIDPKTPGFTLSTFIEALASRAVAAGDGALFCPGVQVRFDLLLAEIPSCPP